MWPATATDAGHASATAASEGFDIVVAMGGDGMVHHVAQGLVGTGTSLGIIPAGTTNVIARLHDVPGRHTRAARLIARQPVPRSIGVASMTLHRGSVETLHHGIFACGMGLDAEVVVRADQDPYRKYRFGSVHYARTAVGVALGRFSGRRPHVVARAGERTESVSTALIQFREVYTYFGRVPIRLSPSSPDPMTVLSIDRLRRWRVPAIAFNALTGRDLTRIRGIQVWEGVDHLRLEGDPPMAIQADGEPLGMVESADVRWAPAALRLIGG